LCCAGGKSRQRRQVGCSSTSEFVTFFKCINVLSGFPYYQSEYRFLLLISYKIAGGGDNEVAPEFAEVAERGFHLGMEMIAIRRYDLTLDGIDRQRLGKNAEKL
jgi:hypothetical protein